MSEAGFELLDDTTLQPETVKQCAKVEVFNRLKLSRLQKLILKAALATLWNREALCDEGCELRHLFTFEVLLLFFNFKSWKRYGWVPEFTHAFPSGHTHISSECWERDGHGQRFCRRYYRVFNLNYSSAYASVRRSFNRLEARGLVTIWRSPVFKQSWIQLTPAGLRLAEELVRPSVEPEPLALEVLAYAKPQRIPARDYAAESHERMEAAFEKMRQGWQDARDI